jgi:hypothetical protein
MAMSRTMLVNSSTTNCKSALSQRLGPTKVKSVVRKTRARDKSLILTGVNSEVVVAERVSERISSIFRERMGTKVAIEV